MEIIWHGYSCFSVKTKNGTALVNPYTAETGLKLANVKADVVVITDEDDKHLQAPNEEVKIFSWPGEYEVSEIAITMQDLKMAAEGKKGAKIPRLLNIDAGSIRVCYINDYNLTLTDEVVESIGNVDILMVPVSKEKGGADKVHAAIEEIEPRIIIPVFYKTPGLKIDLESLDGFIKKSGLSPAASKEKLVVNSKSDLPQEKTECVVLEPQIG